MKFIDKLFEPVALICWLPLLLLSLPIWIQRRSFLSFIRAAIIVTIGIIVPLSWFLLSALLVPEWKGENPMGWFACFSVGKLWLLPLVLWAASAFYARVVWITLRPTQTWIVLGYVAGALVSDFCLFWALLCHHGLLVAVWPFVVPVAAAIYYTVNARRLLAESGWTQKAWGVVASSSLPLWVLSFWQSLKTFESVPDQQPMDCFVVTAAMRGDQRVVGRAKVVIRHGKTRQANEQLVTFWALEDAWEYRAPRSHRMFRMIYNKMGPRLAACLRNRLLADLTFLALKPFEWVARRLIR